MMKQYHVIIEAEKELDIEFLIKAKNCQPPNSFNNVEYRYRIADSVKDHQLCVEQSPVLLAEQFDEIYERLAPSFGYETRLETREFDCESTSGKLMIAVCAEIIKRAKQPEGQHEESS